ncbi:MFS transporter [Actinomadura syzygii]|uniref:MFS transporter n=1 Tax=Actinomadura syzygii TaxID=1427538 RepID=A0A5D0U0P6_9ACTN|nr:MFS transporter [Actinomadura syzygii]TYC11162.1 MFS transporter [Actinomadura syzygii]
MPALSSTRLGAEFTKLWAASAVSNIGDGVTLVAGPLLAATLTRDPALVAGAAFVQALPWLLFSLVSGAHVDRVDRQRLIFAVNVARGATLACLTAMIAVGVVNIPLLYAVFFLLGTGETLADTASVARLPTIVPPERLASANALLMATFTVGNQFLSKPLGAALFAMAAAIPFGVNAVTFVVAALLVASMRPVPVEPVQRTRRALRTEIAEGVRWLWSHELLRTLAVAMGVANLAFCGAFSVFVLYAEERLGLSPVGYGFLLTTFGIGGLVGTAVADRLRRRFGAAALLRGGLVVEAATHLTLALTTRAWLAAAILVVFGVHTMVWGVISATVRQRATPNHLLGRVTSVYSLIDASGAATGMLLGGLAARAVTITTPFWLAGALTAAVVLASWRALGSASAP